MATVHKDYATALNARILVRANDLKARYGPNTSTRSVATPTTTTSGTSITESADAIQDIINLATEVAVQVALTLDA